MAPRLIRWALLGAAGSLLVVWLLLPSGRSIIWEGVVPDESEGTSLEIRRWAVWEARRSAQAEIERRREMADFQVFVSSAIAHREDPVVFAPDSAAKRRVGPARAWLAARWGELPTRDPGLTSVFVLRSESGWLVDSRVARRSDSLCVLNIYSEFPSGLDRGVGECALRERFGPAGRAWRRWIASTYEIPFHLTRGPTTWFASRVETPTPWFEGRWDRWDSWAAGAQGPRFLVSCAEGNPASCESAFGLGIADTSFHGWRAAEYTSIRAVLDSRAALLGATYRELGEKGFNKLWRSDTTIAAGYEQIRGKPIDGLLQQLASSMVGARPKDQGLSPLAWVGALIWLGLLGTWAAYRMNDRRIGL